jgi:hypothetical protein
MAQAVAARAFAGLDYLPEARKAFLGVYGRTFRLAPGPWVRLYSFSDVAVLNAQLQTALSLSIYGDLAHDAEATALSGQMLQSASELFPRFDTGAWSLYALDGPESPLKYHVYVVSLLERIASRTQDPLWEARAQRFDSYTSQRPVLSIRGPRAAVRRAARFSIWLSKISRVTLTIAGGSSSSTLSRGFHTFYWSAAGRRSGHYAARLTAVDLAGNRTAKTYRFVVRRRAARRSPALR